MSNGFYVVPKLVEDVSIKRSIGEPSDDAWNGLDPNPTVISLLKGIVNKLQ